MYTIYIISHVVIQNVIISNYNYPTMRKKTELKENLALTYRTEDEQKYFSL